jgi:hypothetical protein
MELPRHPALNRRGALVALDTVIAWRSHISTILFITGALHLALVGIRKANVASNHPIVKYGEPAVSVALFPVGVIQFISFFVYLIAIIFGLRGPAALPPEWAGWSIPYTVLQGGSMVVGSASAIGQAGRKVPWAVLAGGGIGVVGAGSVWTATNFLGGYAPIALTGFIGIILFVAMFYLTLPAQETIMAAGDAFAFSPVTIINGALMSILGFISGIGVVIL